MTYRPARHPLGSDGGLEDNACSREVDPLTFRARTQDNECEMDDDIGVGDQCVNGVPVHDVALLIRRLCPSMQGRIEWPAGHPDDPFHGGVSFQGSHCRDSNLASRSSHSHGESRRLIGCETGICG